MVYFQFFEGYHFERDWGKNSLCAYQFSGYRLNGQKSVFKFLLVCTHGLRTPREGIAFTARPKIESQSQIFRYGRRIFRLPHQHKFSNLFCLCLYWVSVVRVLHYMPIHLYLPNAHTCAFFKFLPNEFRICKKFLTIRSQSTPHKKLRFTSHKISIFPDS